jgi:hypothetical protein
LGKGKVFVLNWMVLQSALTVRGTWVKVHMSETELETVQVDLLSAGFVQDGAQIVDTQNLFIGHCHKVYGS